MKTLKKADIEALRRLMPVFTKEEEREIVGGAHVIIDVYRYGFGPDSTASTFTVSVVGSCGQTESYYPSMSGYMLEPRVDASLATTSGSDTAIPSGSYFVYQRADLKWELSGVEGRSYIQIHTGNSGSDTTGCLMPGGQMSTDSSGDYYIPVGKFSSSFSQLSQIMAEYGDMITINIH
jgi:hypothetical protein